MRIQVLIVLAATGCGDHSRVDDKRAAPEPAEVAPAHDQAFRVHVDRRDVPLHDLDVATWLGGLPMDGRADVAIDLTVPRRGDTRDYAKAKGSFAFACRAGCTLGDDRTRLAVAGGLPFGHVTFDKVDVRAVVEAGHVEVTRWQLESPDMMLQATLHIDLAANLDDSAIDGCVRFKPAPGLAERDPKTAAVLATTGAPLGPDGVYSIKLEGTLGKRRLLAGACT